MLEQKDITPAQSERPWQDRNGKNGDRGFFITFEGIDGSGKSAHLDRLVRVLREAGHRVIETREPGGTPLGEAIRLIFLRWQGHIRPETELLLLLASRAELTRKIIAPALKRGEIVVCERFTDSTVAYQGYGRGLDLATIHAMNAMAAGITPDLTILLDIHPEEGIRRKAIVKFGSLDRIEAEDLGFHERVRKGYLAIAMEAPERFRIIDASNPVEAVSRNMIATVERFLAIGS